MQPTIISTANYLYLF